MTKQTLLDKAKARKSNYKFSLASNEDIELALAWVRDEISLTQVCVAYDSKPGTSIYSRLAISLKAHIQRTSNK